MLIGVPSETFPGENRVALSPTAVDALRKVGAEVAVQSGAGLAAGFLDEQYAKHGAKPVPDRAAIFRDADIVLQVRALGANPREGAADLPLMRAGQLLIAHGEPLTAHEQTKALAERGVTFFAMELVPRITRAQAMDSLSSQANLAGYKAVLLAASSLGKIFPMMMTAAGTVTPTKVLVVGAGVAGLQAIATARRLGAVVTATDVRAAVKEQVESLGAKFIAPPDTAEGTGGYAKEQTEEQRLRQLKVMADAVAEADVVITTAAIPGRKAPILVTADMVRGMRPGGVIVDLAAERGGNCELTEPDRVVVKHNVTIIGTTNLPATMPQTASTLYANNIVKVVLHLLNKQGQLDLKPEDEITAGALVCHGGKIVHPQVLKAMGV